MVEYVAKLQWLVRDGEDAVDSMNTAFPYEHSKLRKAADDGGYKYDAQAADAVRDAADPTRARLGSRSAVRGPNRYLRRPRGRARIRPTRSRWSYGSAASAARCRSVPE
jgi:hypothetical protein